MKTRIVASSESITRLNNSCSFSTRDTIFIANTTPKRSLLVAGFTQAAGCTHTVSGFDAEYLDVSPTRSYSNPLGKASNECLPHIFQASNRNCMSNTFCSFQYVFGFKKRFCPLINAFGIGLISFVYCSEHSLHSNFGFIFTIQNRTIYDLSCDIAIFPMRRSINKICFAKFWTFGCHIL